MVRSHKGEKRIMRNFYYVYVLLSLKDNNFYIGFTNDLERRTKEHKQGKNISTKSRLPVELIYFEGHLSKEDTMRRESYFKTAKGKTSLRQILKESLQSTAPGSGMYLSQYSGACPAPERNEWFRVNKQGS